MTIKEARKKAGLTQAGMSDMLGIPKRTIEEWEGERRTPPAYVERLVIEKLLQIKDGGNVMKFEIIDNKIYRRGEEIKPNTNGTNGKVVSGMSARGLWFLASTSTENFTVYKKDIIGLAPNAPDVFMSYMT